MKVAIVTSFPARPQEPRGGVQAVSVNLIRELAKTWQGEVHVVTMDRACTGIDRSTWEGATIHRLPWTGRKMLTHAVGEGRRQMRAYLEQLRPDVIHAHDTYGLMVKGIAVPRVFTIHGFIYADTLVEGGRLARVRSWLWRRAEEACWADQPHIISISPYVRERLRGIARGVIRDIDNPVGEEFFQIERREEKGTIFSAGAICPRKNTLGLIEARARMTAAGVDGQLRLAGPTADDGYERRVRELIHARGLEDRVVLLGPIGTEQIRQELAGASAFALVSLEENSPMVIEEAMAAGVPVVTSNRCGMPYMVRDAESGYLVDPLDPDDIAKGLATLLEDDALRFSMGQKGREIAADRFHPAKVAARTMEVYRRAARGR